MKPRPAIPSTPAAFELRRLEPVAGADDRGDLVRGQAAVVAIKAIVEATGLPVLYNTSFNLFGDPLVCNPRDAVRSFYSSGIDTLFVGNFVVEK